MESTVENSAFMASGVAEPEPTVSVGKKPRVQPEATRQVDAMPVQPEKRRVTQTRQATQPAIVQRKIKEIRIFYTDGTYETLVPEK